MIIHEFSQIAARNFTFFENVTSQTGDS